MAIPFTPWGDRKLVDSLILVMTYVMLGWGLNIVVGLAGLLDLGYVAFYAVGAYTYAKLSTTLGFNFWESLPLAGGMAAFFGVVLGFPVLRLRGDYLAIVTLGFGEIIRIILINWQAFTGGPNGIGNIAKIDFFGIPFERNPAEGDGCLPHAVRSRIQHHAAGHLPLLRHRCPGADHQFRDHPVAQDADRPRLGSLARRRNRLPRARHQSHQHQAHGLCHRCHVRGFRRIVLCHTAGLRQSGELHLHRDPPSSSPSSCWAAWAARSVSRLAAILLIGLPEVLRELALYRMLVFGGVMVVIMLLRPKGLLSFREPTVLLKRRKSKAAAGVAS